MKFLGDYLGGMFSYDTDWNNISNNMKNNSYSNIISSALVPNNLSLKKSNDYGIPIYELNGEKFFAFVHVTRADRENVSNPNIWFDNHNDGLSLSYIGNDNLVTFSDPLLYLALII